MRIEEIFRKITGFQNIVLDTVLFESRYPVLFTCKKENDVYLFICCLVTAEKIEWIGTKTTYTSLIELLENKITIRDAFLNVTNDKMIIQYDGKQIKYEIKKADEIPDNLLPTAGEYMDAEDGEYEEEIFEFKERNATMEYVIRPKTNKFLVFRYTGISSLKTEKSQEVNWNMEETLRYQLEKINDQKVALEFA